jgi:hypothetical protein
MIEMLEHLLALSYIANDWPFPYATDSSYLETAIPTMNPYMSYVVV